MYTETRHFSRLVSRYGREYPGTQRTAAVLLIKVPHLHLMSKPCTLEINTYLHLHWHASSADSCRDLTRGLMPGSSGPTDTRRLCCFSWYRCVHAQLISLEAGQLQGAGQKTDLSIHMCITRVKENNWNHQIYNQPERTECWIHGKYKTHAFYKAGLLQPIEIRFDL